METQCGPLMFFVGPDVKQSVKIAARLVTADRLKQLFAIPNGMLVLTKAGEELLPDAHSRYHFPDNNSGPFVVLPEEALQQVPSDEEDNGHAHAESLPVIQETEAQKQAVLQERRKRMEDGRKKLIKDLYIPRHPHLWTLTPERVFIPSFISAAKASSPEDMMKILKKETTATRLFSFDMLQSGFCNELIEEIQHFEASGLPVMRPNSMNNYGVILDELGFYPFLQQLMTEWLAPFTRVLFPDYGGATLDDHHGFIVQYKIGEDTDLGFHYDASEITLNVCLGKTFVGGSLYFRGLLHDPTTHNENFEFNHTSGRALLHIGKHRHGANHIKSGERYNLILWCRSSVYQAAQPVCQCCGDHGEEEDE